MDAARLVEPSCLPSLRWVIGVVLFLGVGGGLGTAGLAPSVLSGPPSLARRTLPCPVKGFTLTVRSYQGYGHLYTWDGGVRRGSGQSAR